MRSDVRGRPGILHKAGRAFKEYAVIVAFLFVCFGAITLLKAAVLKDAGIGTAPWGFAIIRALILGKFMLIGHELRLGEELAGMPLIYPTLYRSFVFVVFLLALLVVEEAVRGLLRGESVAAALGAIFVIRLNEILATTLVMYIALLPYFAVRQIAGALGQGRLRRLFFVDGRLAEEEKPNPAPAARQ